VFSKLSSTRLLGRQRPSCRRAALSARSLMVLVASFAVLGVACRPAPPPPPAPTVIVYGDSFLTQAQAYVAAHAAPAGWRVLLRQYPGSALCDWLPGSTSGPGPNMGQDLETVPDIRAVVVVFTGNMLSQCVQGRGDQVAVYTADSDIAAAFWKAYGVSVAWVSPPGQPGTVGPHPLAAVYQAVAAAHGQIYADGGADLIDSISTTDSWPVDLPCQSFDVAAGACSALGQPVQVRASATDGHLCVDTTYPGLTACPVYSSGVVRWGSAVASAAVAAEQAA
jgi:hypothetical protein